MPITIISFVLQALQGIEQLAVGVPAILAMVSKTRSDLERMQAENRDPTQEEWDSLNAQITAALAELNANG